VPFDRLETIRPMAIRARKTKSDYGTVYRGHEGQWSWLFHRVTGVAIILFLFAHIVDTAVVGWGPEAYNRVVSVYENPLIRVLELGLVAAVIYHALNGVKIMLIDFFPQLVRHIRVLGISTAAAFLASMAPITYIMGRQIVDLIRKG
jgi:succinate dehydrogenase / fumarate reductase cytochrome b subunit